MKNISQSVYDSLEFPKPKGRPFVYTNFVSTIDGKIFVFKDGYWPIGSRTDYETFTFVRAHADIIIDGKNTATKFARNTIQTIHSKSFQNLRREIGKKELMQYAVITSSPDEALLASLKNDFGYKPYLLVPNISNIPNEFHEQTNVINLKNKKGETDVRQVADYLYKQGFKRIFLDGGATLLGSFLEHNLIDELFLTIAPKIFGNEPKATITLVEGILFPPEKIKKFKLLSVKQAGDEVFLRYKVI